MVAPYHPSSNGLAERAVRILKEGLKKIKDGALTDRLAQLLFQYRNTPHSTTGMIPAELLMGRKLRSRLDLIKPNLVRRVHDKQGEQQRHHDQHTKQRTFAVGERVYVKNHRGGVPWLPGVIAQATGPVSYRVEMVDGKIIRSHQDHIRSQFTEVMQPMENEDDLLGQISEDPSLPDAGVPSPNSDGQDTEAADGTQAMRTLSEPNPSSLPSPDQGSPPTAPQTLPPSRRRRERRQTAPVKVYPRRDHRVPEYYGT